MQYVSTFRKVHWLSDCEEFNYWTTDIVTDGNASTVTCPACLDHIARLGNKHV